MSQKMQLKEPKPRAGRRGNNEGSIYQRKDGRWCGQVTTGYRSDGVPNRKLVYGKTRQEVARKVAELVAEVNKTGYVTVSARDERNLRTLMDEWFGLYGNAKMSTRTEVNRRGMLENHVYDEFGDFQVQSITANALQLHFNRLVKTMCADSVSKIKGLLARFFAYALKQGFIKENPMLDVVMRKRETIVADDDTKALRPEIRQQVFAFAMEHDLLKPILITSALTGLRPQEIIALEWRHVNLVKKTLSVRQALTREYELDADGKKLSSRAAIGKTKTPKSVRDIMIPDAAVDALKEWQAYCMANSLVSKYVFPNTRTGEHRTYSGLRSLLARFIKRNGLEDEGISLYTFRHTFATILLEQRENPRIVADLMGHVKTSTTLDIYSHVMSSTVYEKTAQTLDGVFGGYLSPSSVVTT